MAVFADWILLLEHFKGKYMTPPHHHIEALFNCHITH